MRTLLAFIVLATACGRTHHGDNGNGKLLIDRNWIDRMPRTERDKLHVYRFVPTMGGGVFQDRTLYKGTFELFRFKIEGDHIRFVMPETKQNERSQFKIENVS